VKARIFRSDEAKIRVKCGDENDFSSDRIEPDSNEAPCGSIEQGSDAIARDRMDIRDAHEKSSVLGGVTGGREAELRVFPFRLKVEQAAVIGEEGESTVICIHYSIAVAIASPDHERVIVRAAVHTK